jgi:hypothetical protein
LHATTPARRHEPALIGVNNASGWGRSQARRIRGAQIAWARAESGHERVATLRDERFRVLQIVGNVNDRLPLRRVDAASYAAKVVRDVRRDPGAELLEAGNEMYFKGGRCDPRRYARLYMRAESALREADIKTPYLFDLVGTVPGCTQDTDSEWLATALRAEPGLAAKLRSNGVALHPYGTARENRGDSFGTRAVNAQANLLRARLGVVPPIYVTEFGFNTCGDGSQSYDRPNAAAVTRALKSAYAQFLADPNVKGVFYFHSHDYAKGDCWGLLSANGTPRPQFRALSAIAAREDRR